MWSRKKHVVKLTKFVSTCGQKCAGSGRWTLISPLILWCMIIPVFSENIKVVGKLSCLIIFISDSFNSWRNKMSYFSISSCGANTFWVFSQLNDPTLTYSVLTFIFNLDNLVDCCFWYNNISNSILVIFCFHVIIF